MYVLNSIFHVHLKKKKKQTTQMDKELTYMLYNQTCPD